jgi:putative ABC transport system permease protein
MIGNYFVIALRNIVRHKLYSFINIAGLTVGLTCAIFILLFVRDEQSYDKWIPDSEQLYRVEVTIAHPGQTPIHFTTLPFPLPAAMLAQLPEVKAMTRLAPERMSVIVGGQQFSERVDVVDPSFFDVIKLPLLKGDPKRVFSQTESVVLSERMAIKYFGNKDIIGKTINIGGTLCDADGANCKATQHPLIVTGLMRDLPHNTQLSVDIALPNTASVDRLSQTDKEAWVLMEDWGYVRIALGADISAVLAKLNALFDRSVDPKKLAIGNTKASQVYVMHLNQFREDHLTTDHYGAMTPGGSWTTIYGFLAIGCLILLAACFNFTNLATARAMLRAREISLRKVSGASRSQLVSQFLSESLLSAFLSVVLALALTELLQPLFDAFLNRPIGFSYGSDWGLLLAILGIAFLIGLIGGAYPALLLSKMKPIIGLKSSAPGQSGSGVFRTSLVVLQFSVSIGLGVAAVVVFAQTSFARNVDLGFNRNNVVIVYGADMAQSARETFLQTLKQSPAILDAMISNKVPFDGAIANTDVHRRSGDVGQFFRIISVGTNFPTFYGIHLLEGRLLSKSHGGDEFHRPGQTYNILVNASAARRLGYTPEEAIGKTFLLHTTQVTVVGVISDINMESPKELPWATLYRYAPADMSIFSARVRPDRLSEALSYVDRTWKAFAPTIAIRRQFLNDSFDRQFQADERQGAIFILFVGIAVFIACLGLFGLAAFSTERRTREIGLRKTFGAGTNDIIWMLLWQFSIPVLIANAVAWPVAWYYLHDWLEGYAYRIPLSPLYFLGAGAFALLIAWATVFVHARRVANANPILALRYE